jgi:hypothetical protein
MSTSNFWQLVFNQSKVNGAEYFGDRLPSNCWDWPKDTFLQKRLNELKKRRQENSSDRPAANEAPDSKRGHARHQELKRFGAGALSMC